MNYNNENGLYEIVHDFEMKKDGTMKKKLGREVLNGNKFETSQRNNESKTSRIELRLSANELSALKQIAKAEGMTVSAWVRELIAQYKYAI